MCTLEVKDMPTSSVAPGVAPSHKITFTEGSETFWFYYLMRTPDFRPFVRTRDDELVKHIYAKGTALPIEGFISFNLGSADYHLQRLSAHVFTVTSLK
jgi:hypothetical protein